MGICVIKKKIPKINLGIQKFDFGFETEWSYSVPVGDQNDVYTRRDWNQTLITRINEMSARIFQSSLTGGADTIKIKPHGMVMDIITSLEYFHFQVEELATYFDNCMGHLSGRYRVILDNNVPDNEVWVMIDNPKRLERFRDMGDHYEILSTLDGEGIWNRIPKNRIKGKIIII